ncbi:GNAT family N-acetyltransferase [Priestia megaterium]|uniref:GNAT family N-acetyltransferase n=1 Tax=Priestia megaterium TaxID=1404 RepID=UPI001F1C12B6|nr:GNAT family N-acetyltransferase [Priestia megaterium]MCF8890843.1 GNAT family N-acetyltransferase [Priestia megaterium]
MVIEYKVNAPISAKEVADVFKSSGIKRPVNELERIERMIKNSDINLTAWDGQQLVGIARAVTDYSYCCYLSDLAIHKDYQNKGIGKELVQRLQDILGEEVALILLASSVAMDYYPHIGFEKSENAFRIARKK